jgi:hypothetical protein
MSQKPTTEEINAKIKARKMYTGFDESTYHRQELFGMRVKHAKDPHVLFKIKIFGHYKNIYKWTEEQCQSFIDNNLHESEGHTVNGIWYAYDWGTGYNSITKNKMHEPNLDHIIPREQGGKDVPENMRIRCRRLNENKGNTNSDQERFATIVDMFNDMEDEAMRRTVVELLASKIPNN